MTVHDGEDRRKEDRGHRSATGEDVRLFFNPCKKLLEKTQQSTWGHAFFPPALGRGDSTVVAVFVVAVFVDAVLRLRVSFYSFYGFE